MSLVEDWWSVVARLLVTFVKYFVAVGYALWVLGRFGTLMTALPVAEGLLLLLVGAVGCFFIVRSLDRWLASFEAQREAARKPI